MDESLWQIQYNALKAKTTFPRERMKRFPSLGLFDATKLSTWTKKQDLDKIIITIT